MLRSALSWENAWRIRIAALGFMVLSLGIGSQLLVNAVSASSGMAVTTSRAPLKVTAYTTVRQMADGNWTHLGACAVAEAQFPLGTVLALYDADGTFERQCTVEDTDSSIAYDDIKLAMPGDVRGAVQWGVRFLAVQVARLGWGPGGPPPLSVTTAAPPSSAQMLKLRLLRLKAGLK
jgi:hypothetical protein